MAESPKDISGLGLEELKALLVQALEEVARLKAENAELREEIARLKGLKGRPKLKPSGMEKGTEAFPAKGSGKKGRRAYGFDDIAIVPSRRTRDPDDIDITWTLGPYRFELPLLALRLVKFGEQAARVESRSAACSGRYSPSTPIITICTPPTSRTTTNAIRSESFLDIVFLHVP